MKEQLDGVGYDFNSTLFRNFIWVSAINVQAKKFGIPKWIASIIAKKNDIEYVADMPAWEKAAAIVRKKVDEDINFVDNLINITREKGEAFIKWSEEHIHNQEVSQLTTKEILKLFETFIEKAMDVYAHGTFLPLIDFHENKYTEDNLKKILKKYGMEDEFNTFCFPVYDSYAQEQEIALLELMMRHGIDSKEHLELAKQCKEFKNDIKRHTRNHAWVYYHFSGPAFREEDFMNFIEEYAKKTEDPSQILNSIHTKRMQIGRRKKELLKKIQPTAFEEMILNLAGKVVWAKPTRKDYQSKAYYHSEKLLREIARRLHISLNQARSIPFPELEKALEEGPNISLINEFQRFHVCVSKEKTEILYGKAAEEYSKKVNRVECTGEQLRGTCACPGKVRGRVKVINTPEDMYKMEKGDILVSIATNPNVVPAMKKAAAIITDEGGLTCHASIVSRELNIPCIVGTKYASKVLKDGELIRIDAQQGEIQRETEKKRIKLVIFDGFGVSFFGGYDKTADALSKKLGRDEKELHDVMYKYLNLAAEHKVTQEEAWVRSVQDLNLPLSAEALKEIHYSLLKRNEEILHIARVLKEKGIHSLLLTKNTGPQLADVKKILKYENDFSKVINTWEIKLPKASKETMHYCMQEFGVNADEVLFIDDQKGNLKAASELGIKTFLYENNNRELIHFLEKHLEYRIKEEQ